MNHLEPMPWARTTCGFTPRGTTRSPSWGANCRHSCAAGREKARARTSSTSPRSSGRGQGSSRKRTSLVLFTRLMSVPQFINMVVATLAVKLKKVGGLDEFVELDEPPYALNFLW